MTGIPKTFDNTFEKYRGTVPLSYFRALAFASSNMNPKKSVQGSGGLFMISSAALGAFDKKFPGFDAKGGKHVGTDLSDPVLNTAIAAWIIKNIVSYYQARYPKTASEDWNNPNYVAIVTHGFYTGYAEPSGIGSAIKVIEEKSPQSMTIDNVVSMSKELELSENKYNPVFVGKTKAVVNLYVSDVGGKTVADKGPGETTTSYTNAPKKGNGIWVLLAGIPLAMFAFSRKKR